MRNGIAIIGGVLVLILATMAGLGVWLGLPCGPSTCGVGGWLYDFQTLIAGALALMAGALAFASAIHQVNEQRRHRAQDREIAEQRTAHDQTMIVTTVGREFVIYVEELRALIEMIGREAELASETDSEEEKERALAYIRSVLSELIKESISRGRHFLSSAIEALAKLPPADHGPHRLALFALQAAILGIERHIAEVAHTGGAAQPIISLICKHSPDHLKALSNAAALIPTDEDPTPFESIFGDVDDLEETPDNSRQSVAPNSN